MATWKKVIVSGSSANLSTLQVDGLTSGQVVIGGGSGSALSTTAINGTGNILATTGATGVSMTGSFSGSFKGDGSGITGVIATSANALSQGTGISVFSYNGSTVQTVAVSGASSLNSDAITKWDGDSFANTSLSDNGTVVSGASSIQLTGANSRLTGSFSGSFKGDGSQLTGLATTLQVTGSNGSNGSVSLLTQGLTITGTSNEIETSVSGQTVTIGLPDNVTVTQNLTVNGDLVVAGTASFNNQSSLEIADRFVIVASGSSTLTDGGLIVASGGVGHNISGSAFYLESSATGSVGRFAIAPSVHASASSVTADEYMVSAKLSAASAPSVAPSWGGSTNGSGNIWIKQDTGDIYIWA